MAGRAVLIRPGAAPILAGLCCALLPGCDALGARQPNSNPLARSTPTAPVAATSEVAGIPASAAAIAEQPGAAFELRLEGTALKLAFVPLITPTGQRLWMSSTEIPWEAYDVFLFGFDLPAQRRVADWDAAARPSKPYGSPDRGLGHRGFAAMAMTAQAAEAFCTWLGERSGVALRLPTEAEWEFAARAGAQRPAGLADDLAEPRKIPAELGQQVGFAPYDGPRPQALDALLPNPLGLYGLRGNLAEWVACEDGLGFTTAGGCFLDGPEHQVPERREDQAPSWNETDPQNPKSRWWLANAPFVGFRVVADQAPH